MKSTSWVTNFTFFCLLNVRFRLNNFCFIYFCWEFFRDQQKSRELDIVTGFQVLDGQMHLFVLEGLRSGGVQYLWKALPKPENSGKCDFFKTIVVAAFIVLARDKYATCNHFRFTDTLSRLPMTLLLSFREGCFWWTRIIVLGILPFW